MYFPDLSKYSYLFKDANRVNIGWLSNQHPFSVGSVDTMTLMRLEEYLIVNKCRGFHVCEFCGEEKGNGEIEIKGSNGDIFVSPSMIIHYIKEHGYRPPDVFIKAVNGVPYKPFFKSDFKREVRGSCERKWANEASAAIAREVDEEIIALLLNK